MWTNVICSLFAWEEQMTWSSRWMKEDRGGCWGHVHCQNRQEPSCPPGSCACRTHWREGRHLLSDDLICSDEDMHQFYSLIYRWLRNTPNSAITNQFFFFFWKPSVFMPMFRQGWTRDFFLVVTASWETLTRVAMLKETEHLLPLHHCSAIGLWGHHHRLWELKSPHAVL